MNFRKSLGEFTGFKMLKDAYAGKEIPRLEGEPKEIDANIKLAEALGIPGTPTWCCPMERYETGRCQPSNS
jgi:hypothetical protein